MGENKTVISFSISPHTKLKRQKKERTDKMRRSRSYVHTDSSESWGKKSSLSSLEKPCSCCSSTEATLERTERTEGKLWPTDPTGREIIGDCGKWNTGCSSQSQWLHSKNTVAHLHNCVYPHNWDTTLKSFWYTQHASTTTELSPFLKIQLQGARKRRSVPVLMATLIHCWTSSTTRYGHVLQTRTGHCCLLTESGIQTLLAKMWSGAKGLQEKALKHFLPTVTQLLLHPGVPLVFNLLIMAIMASSDPAYPFPSLLHLDGLIIFTSHNTLLKIWSLLQNYHKKKLLPACCFLSAVQASSSTVSASQHETLCCLL